jgi:hypothetical protein
MGENQTGCAFAIRFLVEFPDKIECGGIVFFKVVTSLTIMFALFAIGFVLTQHARQGVRLPASIPKTKIFDFTKIAQGSPEIALRKHILNKSEALVKNGSFGVRVGHFMVQNSEGRTESACDVYDSVTYTFEAEGMAVNGQRPKLILSGLCHSETQATTLEPLWIPVAELMKKPAGNMDYSSNDSDQTTIRLEDMDMIWPRHWVLSTIQFHGRDQSTAPLILDRQEVYRYSRSPLVMYWQL